MRVLLLLMLVVALRAGGLEDVYCAGHDCHDHHDWKGGGGTPAPEPATWLAVGGGLAVIGFIRRKR